MEPDDTRQLTDDLSAYLDGELEPARAAAVRAWLERSPEAQRLLDDLRDVSTAVGGMPRRAAPPDLAARLRSAALGRSAKPSRRLRFPRSPLGLAAAVVLLLAGGWLLFPTASEDPRLGESVVARRLEPERQASESFARPSGGKQRDRRAAAAPAPEPSTQDRFARGEAREAPEEAGRSAADLRAASDAPDTAQPDVAALRSFGYVDNDAAQAPPPAIAAAESETPADRVAPGTAGQAVTVVVDPADRESYQSALRALTVARREAAPAGDAGTWLGTQLRALGIEDTVPREGVAMENALLKAETAKEHPARVVYELAGGQRLAQIGDALPQEVHLTLAPADTKALLMSLERSAPQRVRTSWSPDLPAAGLLDIDALPLFEQTGRDRENLAGDKDAEQAPQRARGPVDGRGAERRRAEVDHADRRGAERGPPARRGVAGERGTPARTGEITPPIGNAKPDPSTTTATSRSGPERADTLDQVESSSGVGDAPSARPADPRHVLLRILLRPPPQPPASAPAAGD